MEEIKIEEKGKNIIHTLKESHDEDSLIEKYRRENMAFLITQKKIEQLPGIISQTDMHLKLIEKQIEINEAKQNEINKIFEGQDIKQKIQELKKKYGNEELITHAEKIIKKTKSSIEKVGTEYLFKSEISQTETDLILELISLKDSQIELIEHQIKQAETLKNYQGKSVEFEKTMQEVKERLNTIKIFFAGRHKDIDKLLDQRANERKKKVAESV